VKRLRRGLTSQHMGGIKRENVIDWVHSHQGPRWTYDMTAAMVDNQESYYENMYDQRFFYDGLEKIYADEA